MHMQQYNKHFDNNLAAWRIIRLISGITASTHVLQPRLLFLTILVDMPQTVDEDHVIASFVKAVRDQACHALEEDYDYEPY